MPSQDISNDSTKRVLPWLVAIAVFMESLDTTILNTAVPAIASALQVAPLSMKAVLSSYTLSLAVFIPVSGWMADRYGTRRVFSAAIGLFTLGSILCGISNSIHMLVICRILQGCGGSDDGAGRSSHHGPDIRQIRTYSRHELCRRSGAYRPDAGAGRRRPNRGISSLADDLLYKRADRHSRSVFCLSSLTGLSRRTCRPARYHRTDSFRCRCGLTLLRAGSFRRAHFERSGNTQSVGAFVHPTLGLRTPRCRDTAPSAPFRPVWHPNFPCLGHRRVHHTPGRGWNAFSSSAALSGRPWLHTGPIRIPDYASNPCGDELKNGDADRSHPLWLPSSAQLQYRDHWTHSRALRHHRARYAGVAHCAPSLLLRILFVPAIHEYEYARIRRHRRKRHEHGEHHRQHWTTDGDQLRRCFGLASCSALYP